jgi:DNA adenine methylase
MSGIVKWAGGKWKTIETLKKYFPQAIRLIDPFAGSMCSFTKTGYKSYWMNDINSDLINMYKCVQKNPEQFIIAAKSLFTKDRNNEAYYRKIRTAFNSSNDANVRAAMFLYLNRHCFNGLCRYSKKEGYFNVPYSPYKNPYFPELEIMEMYKKMNRYQTRLTSVSFEKVMDNAVAGDFIYCDPPYIPASKTANFTEYASGGFGDEEHALLAIKSKACAARGIPVVITNSDTALSREIYAGAKIIEMSAQRNISCKKDGRVPAKEIIAVFS